MASPATNVTRLRPPPPYLSQPGATFWRAITRDYAIDTEGQLATLEVAASALDRLEQCRELIKIEGLVIDDRRVGKIANPLLKIESAARAGFLAAMRALRLQPSAERDA